MLRSATHEAPGYNDYTFDSMEDYQNFLAALADMFDAVKDENWENEENNEWWEIYHDSIHNPNDYSEKEAEEARSNFWNSEIKLSEERKAMTKEVFAQLAEHFYDLWY